MYSCSVLKVQNDFHQIVSKSLLCILFLFWNVPFARYKATHNILYPTAYFIIYAFIEMVMVLYYHLERETWLFILYKCYKVVVPHSVINICNIVKTLDYHTSSPIRQIFETQIVLLESIHQISHDHCL